MKRAFLLLCLVNIFILNSFAQSAHAAKENNHQKIAVQQQQDGAPQNDHTEDGDHAEGEEQQADDHGEAGDHEGPAGWSVIPFILLLLMIATGPLFYEHFWHKNYPIIAIFLALIVVVYYLFVLHNAHNPVHHLAEYVQFISLVGSLFVASGGILLKVNKKGTPFTNVILLAAGSVLANFVSTIGASMLLIRPFIRLNRDRIKPYHIVFFIFTVSNIGGCLTPIGDPPLFLGFLKGVPFFWTLTHNIVPWALAIATICAIFYVIDSRNKSGNEPETSEPARAEVEEANPGIAIQGKKNFIWLLIIVLAVFIDPNVFNWVPGIPYHGANFSFIREIIMITVAFLSYFMADKDALKGNEFNFEPIREVGFLFIGIFGTMMPALELVGNFAQSEEGMEFIGRNTLFWGTGILSGFLDNAPTYLNFLAAGMAAKGGEINQVADVVKFAQGGYPGSVILLKAVSIAAVFFGAMTYIGNAPNFMVKSIAEQVGIKMPSFFGYMIRFSIPILIPLFIIFWLIFFYFA